MIEEGETRLTISQMSGEAVTGEERTLLAATEGAEAQAMKAEEESHLAMEAEIDPEIEATAKETIDIATEETERVINRARSLRKAREGEDQRVARREE